MFQLYCVLHKWDKSFEFKSFLQGFWLLVVLLSRVFKMEGFFVYVMYKNANAHTVHILPIVPHVSGEGKKPRYAAIHQQSKERRRMPATSYSCKQC